MKILLCLIATCLTFSSCRKDPKLLIESEDVIDGGEDVIDGFHVTTLNKDNSGLPDSVITALAVDFENVVWIGSQDGGLTSYDGINWTVFNTSNSVLPSNSVNSISVDRFNTVWVGTSNGLASITNGIWKLYNSGNSPFTTNWISKVRCDSLDNIWVAFHFTSIDCNDPKNSIMKFDGSTWTVYDDASLKLNTHRISDLEIDPLNRVWIASARSSSSGWMGGFFVFDGNITDTLDFDLSYPLIDYYNFYEIAYDPAGYMWMNSFHSLNYTVYTQQFIDVYDPLTFENDSMNNALNELNLSFHVYYPHFAFTQSHKWISSGRVIDSYYLFPYIAYWDGGEWHKLLVGSSENFDAYDVTCMQVGHPDTLWVGTLTGLLKIY